MVLVAVIGPVGSGKTTTLSLLAQWARENKKSVDGFLAIPQARDDPQKGAQEYILQQIESGNHLNPPFDMRGVFQYSGY